MRRFLCLLLLCSQLVAPGCGSTKDKGANQDADKPVQPDKVEKAKGDKG